VTQAPSTVDREAPTALVHYDNGKFIALVLYLFFLNYMIKDYLYLTFILEKLILIRGPNLLSEKVVKA
jgi:hypothetical protein